VRFDRVRAQFAAFDRARLVWGTLLATLVVVVAWDFLAATTFFGDDHLFLAFARLSPHPFTPFVSDQHGGEYYRPLPMALWWLLVHLAGERHWVFASTALILHTGTAALTAALARRLGLATAVAATAAAVFLVAPAGREAASWFSASTDLLATAFTLASIVCLLGTGRRAYAASLLFAALAYLSKESALALPLLAAAAAHLRPPPPRSAAGEVGRGVAACAPPPPRSAAGEVGRGVAVSPRSPLPAAALLRALPHLLLALLYLAVRFAILHGPGGAGDGGAPLWARALQIAAGLVHALTGDQVLPEPLLWSLGLAALAWGAWAVRRDPRLRFPLLWMALALAPLPAAGWVVGARYFYLPAVGLAVLVAHQLWTRGPAVAIVAVAFLLALGSARAALRRAEITHYRDRVAAAADAVATLLPRGHRLFHCKAGIKDLDLVLKDHPRLRAQSDGFLVLGDVPASFVLPPPDLEQRTRFLRADPPLPPSGAYRFGTRSIVGLARRHESPDLEVVIARLPELRFIQLVPAAGGVGWRDVTPGQAR
jgi:hypothetical protein